MMRIIILVATLLLSAGYACSEAIIDTDFNDETFGGMSAGIDWSIDTTGGVGGTPAAKLYSDEVGVAGHVLNKYVSIYDTNTFWVEFDVKFSTNPVAGPKFLKFFGGPSSSSNNNLSFWITNGSGLQAEVGYYVDALCVAEYDGGDRGSCSPTHVITGSSINFGTTWKHYKVYMKRADNGVVNGEVKVWLDSTLIAHITNMNSNPSGTTSTYINEIRLGDYTATADPFTMWIDNLYIGTTEKDAATCEEDSTACTSQGECTTYWPTYNWCSSDSPPCTDSACSTTCETDADLCDTEGDCSTYWPAYNWCPGDDPSCKSSPCNIPSEGSISQPIDGVGSMSQDIDGLGSCSQ